MSAELCWDHCAGKVQAADGSWQPTFVAWQSVCLLPHAAEDKLRFNGAQDATVILLGVDGHGQTATRLEELMLTAIRTQCCDEVITQLDAHASRDEEWCEACRMLRFDCQCRASARKDTMLLPEATTKLLQVLRCCGV